MHEHIVSKRERKLAHTIGKYISLKYSNFSSFVYFFPSIIGYIENELIITTIEWAVKMCARQHNKHSIAQYCIDSSHLAISLAFSTQLT